MPSSSMVVYKHIIQSNKHFTPFLGSYWTQILEKYCLEQVYIIILLVWMVICWGSHGLLVKVVEL